MGSGLPGEADSHRHVGGRGRQRFHGTADWQAISGPLGQQVVVENRGGSSVIPGEVVVNAAPDGYTLLFASSSLWLAPLLQKTSYDPVRDLAPISLIDRAPNILVVHPSLPVGPRKN